jgi:hypothetical protein
VAGRPLLPSRQQRDYLAERIEAEINRNRGVIGEAAIKEYVDALSSIRSLQVQVDP